MNLNNKSEKNNQNKKYIEKLTNSDTYNSENEILFTMTTLFF